MSKKVLVVGGAGQTGHQICEAISQRGHSPITLDNLSTGDGNRVTFGPLVKVDAQLTPRVIRALKEHEIQTIVHCALSKEHTNPLDLYDQNLTTTMSLLQALQETKGKKLFLMNPPELTKEMLERILKDCSNAYGYEAQILEGSTPEILEKLSQVL